MNCIYFKIRTKDYKKYIYCKVKKKKITYADCKICRQKQYKEITKIKGKKRRSTKATEIPTKLKKVVWERDGHKCIFCEKQVDVFYANAHFIKRSQGGLGIPENIVTLCPKCHYEEDMGQNTKLYEDYIESYLKDIYGTNWNKSKLIYKKWRK